VRVLFKNRFTKQIEKLRDNNLKAEVKNIIISAEECNSIMEKRNLKKRMSYNFFTGSELATSELELKLKMTL
jgi:hypothetical protein